MAYNARSRHPYTSNRTVTASMSTATSGRYSNHTRIPTIDSTVHNSNSSFTTIINSTTTSTILPIITPSTLVVSTSKHPLTSTHLPQLPTTPTPTPSQTASRSLSSTAAMGVGVSIGVAGIISLVSLMLLIYRHKRRQSPEYQHYQQAKLWKGFTPQTRSSQYSTTSTVDEKLRKHVYVAELPVPPSPLIVISPALSSGSRMSWNSPLPSPYLSSGRPVGMVEIPL